MSLLVSLTVAVSPALGSRRQLAMFEDDTQLLSQPEATLDTFRQLGVGVVRVAVQWSKVAPRATSSHRPAGFNASDPASYPAANWSSYDAVVRDAAARAMQVDLTLTAPAPMWANGPGAPGGRAPILRQWKPSPREFGAFVRAIATRYSGHYRPPGSATALPRVSFWALWNEPNFGKSLAPQAVDGSSVSTSPMLYRALLDAGWSALQETGHGHDTILIGSLSARGSNVTPTRGLPDGLPGKFGQTKPLQFIRSLYCLDSRYRQLRGAAARTVSCPTSARASRRFRSSHPALFEASGFADHPYPVNLPPTRATSGDPDYTEYSQLPRLAGTLDRAQRAYRSFRRLPLYITEYGYITNPPNNSSNHFPSPATAAYYINWAEYLSWRNPRIATTMQYLLMDPNPRVGVPEFGGFASGLEFYGGAHKPSYDAYRLPLYIPVTSSGHGGSLEVWGCVRPAHYATLDTGQPQSVQIQFAPASDGGFSTMATIPITDPDGYIDTHVMFPSSGSVRLAWTYPMGGSTVFSRTQRVSVS
jgi:hypothetical protein